MGPDSHGGLRRLPYLGACVLSLAVGPRYSAGRAVRLLALVDLFLRALGAKEIAVTLPGMLMRLAENRLLRGDARAAALGDAGETER